MSFLPYYLVLIGIFDVLTIFGIWDPYFINEPKITQCRHKRQYFIILILTRIVTSSTETLNCDISSLENNREMVD